jgi:hypothetical protein
MEGPVGWKLKDSQALKFLPLPGAFGKFTWSLQTESDRNHAAEEAFLGPSHPMTNVQQHYPILL